jgi:hypothetical protein
MKKLMLAVLALCLIGSITHAQSRPAEFCGVIPYSYANYPWAVSMGGNVVGVYGSRAQAEQALASFIYERRCLPVVISGGYGGGAPQGPSKKNVCSCGNYDGMIIKYRKSQMIRMPTIEACQAELTSDDCLE